MKGKATNKAVQSTASSSSKTGRAMLLDLNLPQLQNFIKRDAKSYRDDFLRQLRHYESSMEILRLQPSQDVKDLADLILFIAHVAHCFPEETRGFADEIMTLLRQHYAAIQPELRKTFVQALMLLRSKKILEQTTLLPLLFFLLRCHDKQLRQQLYTYIVSDIKAANQKCKNHKLNKTLQNFMFTLITAAETTHEPATAMETLASGDATDIAAKYSLDACIELYRRNIWNDIKTVNIIAEACFSPYSKVMATAIKFFLTSNETQDDESDEEEGVPDIQNMQYRATFTKKSRSSKSKLERAMKTVKRKERKSQRAENFNFSALHMLNDPQGMAEKLFSRLTKATAGQKTSREMKFEVRVMVMNLISRIIGLHKLILLNFYPFMVKYLKPHQPDVTLLLAICAQASHDLVPPDAVGTILKAVMDNFVMDSCAGEVISAGLNAIREICVRCPLAMEEEVLGYLITFKSNRDKGAGMAARSLISLYREVNPEILPRRERGKVATMDLADGKRGVVAKGYGYSNVADGVDGVELLALQGDAVDPDDDAAWQVDSDDDGSKSSDGWVKIQSDNEADIGLSDGSDDEESGRRKRRRIGKRAVQVQQDDDDSDDEEMEELEMSEGDDDVEIDSEVELDSDEMEMVEEDMESGDEIESDVEAEADEVPGTAGEERKSRLEMTRILTPADFAMLKKLREEKQAEKLAGLGRRERSPSPSTLDNIVSASTIEGPRSKRKQTREERIETVMEGRKDRPKFGSRKGKDRGSTTNKEKSKGKNFVMMAHKRSVMGKKKMSLRDKQIRLRKAIDKQKRLKH